MDFEVFFEAYLICALWSSIDENGDTLDKRFSGDDFSDEAREVLRGDCQQFFNENHNLMYNANTDSYQHGVDFWLTQNGHGAGFWDRGYGLAGDDLTKQAKAYGERFLYVGDDGMIHV